MPSRPDSRRDRDPAIAATSGAATDYPLAVWLSKALRNLLRNALIGQTGAVGLGCRPAFQPQLSICLNTFGSWAMIEIGTSWLELCPLTIGSGWWSPRAMTTRFLSW